MLNSEELIRDDLSESDFLERSIGVFRYQYSENAVYRAWVDALKLDVSSVQQLHHIPFLPIEFFKTQKIVTGKTAASPLVFTSSSTTSQVPSKHYVGNSAIYEQSFFLGFDYFYGPITDYCFLALLPNYLQRQGSSLVYMCQKLIEASGHKFSGFFLDDYNDLLTKLHLLNGSSQKTILIGVSYALMDLCDMGLKLENNIIVMETGGMKGSRRDLPKSELHGILKSGLGLECVHGEYGMTELLSQAYSKGGGCYESPPWMRFLIREVEDPMQYRGDHKTGGINVVDLANINSCSFIATKDLGFLNQKGQLELMGRFDNSDVRGCNLMYEGN